MLDRFGGGVPKAPEDPANREESGADDLLETTAAYTYDGDRTSHDHESGLPQERDLVLGDEDPRDAGLAEHVQTEDVAWRGRIFDVDRLQVKLPDGREAIRDVVRHPGAVAIVALTADGKICLVRQYRTALGRVTVEIPAGKLDPGEDPLDCATRDSPPSPPRAALPTSSSTSIWQRASPRACPTRTRTSSSTWTLSP